MIFRPLTEHPPGPTVDELRARALTSAVALRDRSLDAKLADELRRACRTVMRHQAMKWRNAEAEGETTAPRGNMLDVEAAAVIASRAQNGGAKSSLPAKRAQRRKS